MILAQSDKNNIKRREGQQAESGVTLIELFIALALTAILSVIIYGVVISQSRAYTIQENITRLQQSLRLSMDFLSRNIAMAGYGTPGYTLTDIIDEIPNGLLPAIRGYDGGTGAPDAVQVVFADPTNLVMTAWDQDQSTMTTSLVFSNTSDASAFADADYMLCFDYSDTTSMKSWIYGVVSANTSTGVVTITTPDNPLYYGDGGQAPADENLPRDLQCGPAQIFTFYIDSLASDGKGPGTKKHPVLMMSTEIDGFMPGDGAVPQDNDVALADNIEDLQLEVCRATGGTEPSCDSGWADWTAADNTWNGVLALRQVKITVWARGERRAPSGQTAPGPLNPLTGEDDGYQRHRDSTIVLLRNLRMLAAP